MYLVPITMLATIQGYAKYIKYNLENYPIYQFLHLGYIFIHNTSSSNKNTENIEIAKKNKIELLSNNN